MILAGSNGAIVNRMVEKPGIIHQFYGEDLNTRK
jgi:hypothetical protein